MTTFRTEIKHGVRYRDKATGFEGTCTSVIFFEHGCERASLKGINTQGEVVEYYFDAPELEAVATNKPVKLIEKKTGGPHDRVVSARRGVPGR